MTQPSIIAKRLKVFQSLFKESSTVNIENPEERPQHEQPAKCQKYEVVEFNPPISFEKVKAVFSKIGDYSDIKMVDGLYLVYFNDCANARTRLAKLSADIMEKEIELEKAMPLVMSDEPLKKEKCHYTIKNIKSYTGIKGRNSSNAEKLKFTVNLKQVACKEDKRTTLMIKNIPNKYSQIMLLELISQQFEGQYDFFYLPIDFKNKCNVGYAFINMVSLKGVDEFYRRFNGFKWTKFHSEKICEITYARVQGKSSLVDHFKSSSIMRQVDQKVKPVVIN